MHRLNISLLIFFLTLMMVGVTATAAAPPRSHELVEPTHITANPSSLDVNLALGLPVPADACHEACNWLVEWYWLSSGQIIGVRSDQGAELQLPDPIRVVLPPPRSA